MPSKAKKSRPQPSTANPQPVKNIANRVTSAQEPPKAASPNSSLVNGHPADADSKTGDTTESAGERNAPAINRKKQKRREKEAAKRAAQHGLTNGHSAPTPGPTSQPAGRGPPKGYFTEDPDLLNDAQQAQVDGDSHEEDFYSGDEDLDYDNHLASPPNSSWLNTSKRKKSKKKRGATGNSNLVSRTSTTLSRPHPSSVSNAALRSAHRMSNDLWNPTTQTERDQIKEYWLQLGEDERRNLVRIEKEAVLKKMKEQQKHSCSCSVCGRKRTAIEEELEVLYDAYYEELEQFATPGSGAPLPPARATAYRRHPQQIPGAFSTSRVHELDDEDDYDDEEEEYDYSEEDDEDLDYDLPPGPADFFHFGNSLQVKDGILTVADDLLKNEGRNFIDMMEQLAERRMQREEEIHFPSSALAHQDIHQGHDHAPLDDEDDYDDEEEDDEDYDSQEEDDFEGDEMEDSMTEEQRMEEGRRMFQIFAARMFEQRVLTAWREKVAAERTQALIEELNEDQQAQAQKEAKKARDAAKKKEKKKALKAARDEEKARKEAEKAAQEAATKEAEEKRLEEQRQRKEEQRRKREAERKALEEDRFKKEADKARRQQEQKERQAEAERRQREAKERERLKREEAKKKEREEREAREREARERKARDSQDRKAREEQIRREREGAAKDANLRTGPPTSTKPQPIALPPGLTPPSRPGPQVHSPNIQPATPIVPPKVPTPARNRQSSQPSSQPVQSHGSSPRSQQASTELSVSPASAVPHTPASGHPTRTQGQPPVLHHPQPSAPRSPLNNHNRNQYAFNMNGLPGLGVSGQPSGPGMMPGMMPQMPVYGGPPGAPPMGRDPRFLPNGMPYPQAFNGPRHFQPPQPMPFHSQAPVNAPMAAPQQPTASKPSHSRQASGSNVTDTSSQPAPIGRPGPIARPSSTTPDKQIKRSADQDVEQITTQLGSKALLDDSDDPIPAPPEARASLPSLGAPGTGRMPFASPFAEPKVEPFNHGWGGFGSTHGWGPPPGPVRPGWGQQAFGAPMMSGPPSISRSHLPRPISVRLMLVDACRQLGAAGEVMHPVQSVLRQLEMLKAPGEPPVSMDEMLGICDTEGNAQNGGGSFEVMMDKSRGQVIRFTEDNAQPRSSVGDIGSPLPSHSQTAGFPVGQSFGPPGRGF